MREFANTRKLYETFHGRKPSGIVGEVDIPVDSEGVVVLGRAVAIEYECNKLNGGGDGKSALYRHEFHPEDVLLATDTGTMLLVVGPKLHITDEGIVN